MKKISLGEAITLANSRANEMGLTEEERILRKPRECMLKLRYVGESFGALSLTNGKIYYAIDENEGMYRVIDDSGEDYLYSKENPAPLDGSSPGGRWEIV